MSVSLSFRDPSEYFPLSITDRFGVALYYPKGDFRGYRALAIQMEVGQVYMTIKDSLLHSTTSEQYDSLFKVFYQLGQKDKMIHTALEHICRDEDLLKHKKELPCDSGLKRDPLTECRHSNFKGELTEVEKGYENDSFYVNVVVNHYRSKKNKGWKETHITLPCTHEGRVFPYCYVHGESLVSAVLLDEKAIQVAYYPKFSTHPRDKKMFMIRDNCENTPVVTTDGKWIALINNNSVIVFLMDDPSTCFNFAVDGDVPSALKLKNDQLCIGTLDGRYYRMDIESGKTLYSEQFVQRIAILDIQYVGVRIAIQTMTDARFVEESQNRVLYLDRPVSIAIKGSLLVMLNKYGATRFIENGKEETHISPPEGVKINIMDISPWYQNAIWFDDEKVHVLLSNGIIFTNSLPSSEERG